MFPPGSFTVSDTEARALLKFVQRQAVPSGKQVNHLEPDIVAIARVLRARVAQADDHLGRRTGVGRRRFAVRKKAGQVHLTTPKGAVRADSPFE